MEKNHSAPLFFLCFYLQMSIFIRTFVVGNQEKSSDLSSSLFSHIVFFFEKSCRFSCISHGKAVSLRCQIKNKGGFMEYKLKVELTEKHDGKNPFYGKRACKVVLEEVFSCEFDNRELTAPHDLNISVMLDDGAHASVRVDSGFLEYAGYDRVFVTYFTVRGEVYEVEVSYDDDWERKDLTLSVWKNSGSFDDGDDADRVYTFGNDFF